MQALHPIAHTQQGTAHGQQDGQVCAWLGLPYAQAPVGERRFTAPQAPLPWSGVRVATSVGAACPQKVVGKVESLGPRLDEDCLTLNIWSPAPDEGKRPVMVWIHGGAFVLGSAKMFNGAHLAEQGDIVVVALNYRLGVLGFVNFGEVLGDERIDSNLGLRDQIAALRWVRDNIAAFGGDPDRVTISGESAGSMSVSLLMHSKEAQPLFHGAIMQSGALSLIHDHEMSLKVANLYLDALGLRTLDALQRIPTSQLLAAQASVHKQVPLTIPAAPWFDGGLLPASLAAARDASTPAIPLLAGFNRDEIRMFELMRGLADVFLARDSMARLLRAQLGEEATKRILAAYPQTKQGRRALGTHMSFGMPTLHFAERHSVRKESNCATWFYRFDCAHPLLGAVHGIELFYLWNMQGFLPTLLRGAPLWGQRMALAQRFRKHWISFVRDGHPGGDWPSFDSQRHTTMIFNRRDEVVHDPERERRIAWARHDSGPGVTSCEVAS